MLPLYQVLLVTLLGIVGAMMYLYKPDDPTVPEEERTSRRNYRQIGMIMVIVAAIGGLYLLFFSPISFRAAMDGQVPGIQQQVPIQQQAPVQQQVPMQQVPVQASGRRRGVWDAVSEVGGKWVDVLGRTTGQVVGAVAQNPDLIKTVAGVARGT